MTEPPVVTGTFVARREGDRISFDGVVGARGLQRRGARWEVLDGRGRLAEATLERIDDGGPAWVLRTESAEVGRASRDETLGPGANLYYLLWGDGRVFRLVPRGGPQGGYDLLGWETPGAFLEARAVETGWRVIAGPAGLAMADPDAVAVLFAAAVLDAEHPLDRSDDA